MRGGINIKKLITAIGTNELNRRIKENGIYEVIGNDIPYQDGVLDILKGNSDINVLILSELLVGEYDVKKFLSMIKEINPYIEIIFFMKEPNDDLKTFLIGSGVKKIYIDNESSIEEIINGISKVNINSDLNMEIEMLKKMIEEKSVLTSNEEKEKPNQKKNKTLKIPKTIAVAGNYGSGKSLVTAMLARTAKKYKSKVIIIDFDIFNKSINNMFNISKYNQNYKICKNIDQCIIKINENISVFAGIDMLFNETNKISFEKIKELLEKLKEKFDLILIDTSSETNLKYVKTALVNSEKIIFLVEPNLLEIKKAEELLEIYLEDWEIPSYKFGIVLNKVNVNSVDDEIVKNLFSSIKIIGKINFSKAYTALANNINSNFIGFNNYEKILKKIS